MFLPVITRLGHQISNLVSLNRFCIPIISSTPTRAYGVEAPPRSPASTQRSLSLRLSPSRLGLGAVALATVLVGGSLSQSMFTFNTADDIPSSYLTDQREISARVVRVVDGDTYRVRHLPFFFSSGSFEGSLLQNTISVRIVAVDTPETAKFGAAGQKYGDAAADFARQKLSGKRVSVKLHGRDRYHRVLGSVYYQDGFFKRDIGEELVKSGLAVVYRQSGGKYPNGIAYWNKAEEEARRLKRGIWSEPQVELPSEYKKKMREKALVGN